MAKSRRKAFIGLLVFVGYIVRKRIEVVVQRSLVDWLVGGLFERLLESSLQYTKGSKKMYDMIKYF